jgi:hypothetical protein
MSGTRSILRRAGRLLKHALMLIAVFCLCVLAVLWGWTRGRIVNLQLATPAYHGTTEGWACTVVFRDGRFALCWTKTHQQGAHEIPTLGSARLGVRYWSNVAPYKMGVGLMFRGKRPLYEYDGLGFGTGVFDQREDSQGGYRQEGWLLILPVFVPVVLLALVLVRPTLRLITRCVRRHRHQCLTCGYDLRGNASGDRCPECGSLVPHEFRAWPVGLSTGGDGFRNSTTGKL